MSEWNDEGVVCAATRENEPASDLSRTVRMSLQSLWRILNEHHSLGAPEPPPALPSDYRADAPLPERIRKRVDWVMQCSAPQGNWKRSARLETSLSELMAEEQDAERCVDAMRTTGLLDEERAALHSKRFESTRGDDIAQRVMVGRLASELSLQLAGRGVSSAAR